MQAKVAASPQLVDPAVSQAKLKRELGAWARNESEYRRQGWILLSAEGLEVEVAFASLIPMGGAAVPVVLPVIHLSYENYDLWPPSLTFIDLFSREPMQCLVDAAWVEAPDGSPRNVLITNADGKQFLCFPGTREYHEHPDHDGDVWELYRAGGHGSLAVICERVHSTIGALVGGVQVNIQPGLLYPAPGGPTPAQTRQLALQARSVYDQRRLAQASELDRIHQPRQ
jgi:hypothetical protein